MLGSGRFPHLLERGPAQITKYRNLLYRYILTEVATSCQYVDNSTPPEILETSVYEESDGGKPGRRCMPPSSGPGLFFMPDVSCALRSAAGIES